MNDLEILIERARIFFSISIYSVVITIAAAIRYVTNV